MTFKKGRPVAVWDDRSTSSCRPAPIMKSHGPDFNNMWLNSMPSSSGPFKFQSWTKGQQLTIVKNPKWKAGPRRSSTGSSSASSRARLRVPGAAGRRDPGHDAATADPDRGPVQELEVHGADDGPGFQWQHVDIQPGRRRSPALDKKYVREALVRGINRQQIVNALWIQTGLVKSAKDLPVLQNNIFFPQQARTSRTGPSTGSARRP